MRSAIVGGEPDLDGHPAVAALLSPAGSVVCTGTLISERTLVTAAHCPIEAMRGGGYSAFFGPKTGGPGTTIPIVFAESHPGFERATFDHDLAMVALGAKAPVAPVTFGAGVVAAAELRIVGFGVSAIDLHDQGTRRVASTTVATVRDRTFTTPTAAPQACLDDSGGPAFLAGELVGVVSFGDTRCEAGATYTTVAAHADFVRGFVARMTDGAAKDGEPCYFAEHCGGAACLTAVDDPAIHYCGRSCAADADCPASMRCTSGSCRYPLPTPGAIGASCASDDACTSGFCAKEGTCSRSCVADGDCPSGFVCSLAAIPAYCAPAEPPRASGGSCALGAPRAHDDWSLVLLLLLLVRRRHA